MRASSAVSGGVCKPRQEFSRGRVDRRGPSRSCQSRSYRGSYSIDGFFRGLWNEKKREKGPSFRPKIMVGREM